MPSDTTLPEPGFLAVLVWSLWLAGCVLLAVLSLAPGTSSKARSLWGLMASEGLIVFCATTPLLLGATVTVLVFLPVIVRVGWETGFVYSLRLPEGDVERRQFRTATIVLITAMGILGYMLPVWISLSGIAVVIAMLVFRVLVSEAGVFGVRYGTTQGLIDTAVYPGLPVAAFAAVAANDNWLGILLIAFILVETFDSFALLGGRLYGKQPLFPRTSARKTVEGFVTGIAALFVISLILNWFLDIFTVLQCIGIAFAVAGAAVAGDFLASTAKRAAGVKDYPAILKVQGGILDIIDSWLVAGPVIVMVFWLYGLV